jgi:hypothetical protein
MKKRRDANQTVPRLTETEHIVDASRSKAIYRGANSDGRFRAHGDAGISCDEWSRTSERLPPLEVASALKHL